MKKLIIVLTILIVGVLYAQSPSTIWNPSTGQNDWTAQWWMFANSTHQIPLPSPFYASQTGIDPEGFLAEIDTDFLGWELLTFYMGNGLMSLQVNNFNDLFPMVILYLMSGKLIRATG